MPLREWKEIQEMLHGKDPLSAAGILRHAPRAGYSPVRDRKDRREPIPTGSGIPVSARSSRVEEEVDPGKLAGMETDAIVTRLRELGTNGGRGGFIPLTEGHTAAWSIGEQWLAEPQCAPDMQDEDFVCLAACELWKRYCPERPSEEMVDDWVSEGYDYLEANDNRKAVDAWLPVWETVLPRLRPDMRTFRSVDPLFRISQFFGNWIHEYLQSRANQKRVAGDAPTTRFQQ